MNNFIYVAGNARHVKLPKERRTSYYSALDPPYDEPPKVKSNQVSTSHTNKKYGVAFGLMEKDVLCATMNMTVTVGVDFGFFLGCFLLILYHIASKNEK